MKLTTNDDGSYGQVANLCACVMCFNDDNKQFSSASNLSYYVMLICVHIMLLAGGGEAITCAVLVQFTVPGFNPAS